MLSLWALAATIVALQACGPNSDNPAVFSGSSGEDASAPPACKAGVQGCACAKNGETVACGEIVKKNGSYVTCSMGHSTCEGTAWGPCVGNVIVEKSTRATTLGGAFEPLNLPAPCSDLCDPNPNCTTVTGVPGDVDAAGVYPAPEGGITLGNGDASTGPCTGLQCYVAQCSGGATTTITGVVTDPGGNVPLYNATVYIPVDPTGTIPAFTTGVTCDQCAGAVPPNAVAVATTDTTGTFTLTGVPTGSGLIVPIVVQMGKWRREILLDGLSSCTNNVVTTNCTATDKTMCTFRLPRNQHDGYNPADGLYDHADMPQMAMVTGSADPLECILLKAGISESEFSSYTGTNSNPSAKVHLYESPVAPGSFLDSHLGANIAASTLWADTSPTTVAAPHYAFYDVVLNACEGEAVNKHSEHPVNNQTGEPYYNLINYTNAGGRAFLTHYSYTWLQYASAYNYVTQAGLNNWSTLATWEHTPLTGTIGTQDPLTAYVINDFAKGAAYEQWLYNVGASVTLDQLILHEARQDLYDPAGKLPATNASSPVGALGTNVQPWLNATDTSVTSNKTYVPHFTFNTPVDATPANQCGRVVYSDFHVSANALVSGGPVSCTENSQCGFGQTCTGHPGTSGTCSEPCTTNVDCHDSTYSCVGATAGQCLPTSCKAGTPTFACPGGLVCDTATHTNCFCTADNQCPSGKCINSLTQNQCSGLGPCTGLAANGLDPSTSCQLDAPVACPGTTTYSCSDTANPAFSCTTASGTCTGVVTGNALTTCTQPPPTCASGVPNPIALGGHAVNTECWCNADSQCPSLKCINSGQTGCTGVNCTGSGSQDPVTGCQVDTVTACNASYACSDSHYSGCTSGTVGAACPGDAKSTIAEAACSTTTASCSSGVLNSIAVTGYPANSTCWCTSDSQCPSRHCYNQGQCSGTCTGTTTGLSEQTSCDGDAQVACNTTYSCSDSKFSATCVTGSGTCPGVVKAGSEPAGSWSCTVGTANASSPPTNCLCQTDSQCGSGICVSTTATWNGLASCNPSSNCTGSVGKGGWSAADAHNCQYDNETLGVPTGGGVQSCPDDSSRGANPLGCSGGQCGSCWRDDQCKASGSGRCGNAHWSGCQGRASDPTGCCDPGQLGEPPTGVGGTCSPGSCDTTGYPGDCECSADSQCGAYQTCSSLESGWDWFGCDQRNAPGSSAGCTTGAWEGNYWGCACTSDAQCGADSYCLSFRTGSGTVCASGQAGCTCPTGATCTGNSYFTGGNIDSFYCIQRNSPVACSPPFSSYSCSTGTSNAAHSECVCSSDNQCNSGKCASDNPGCSGSCTGAAGQGGTDGCVTACSVSLGSCSPGTPNAANNECLCTNDNQCESGHCEPATVNGTATCTLGTPCTGTGASLDAHNCVVPSTGTVSSSATETCSNGTTPQGSQCWCANDNQCSSGVCVATGNSNCTGSNCSGTGAFDTSHCSTAASPTCSGSASCPLGGSTTCSGGNCKCGANSDCPTGVSCGGGSTDDLGCAMPAPLTYTGPGTPSCPAGGTCNTGTMQCQCSADNQCPSGACVCGGAACSGSGPTDAHGCATTAPTCGGAAYACSLSINGHVPTCDPGTHNCKCSDDSQCPGSKCVNTTNCTGTCSGSGSSVDDLGCVLPPTLPPVTVPAPTCPAAGTCNTGTNQCFCTNDNQCPTGACVNSGQAGCTGTTCTGTGATDVHSCSTTTPTCSGTTNYACPGGTGGTCNGSHSCICNADSQCGTGGKCVNVGQVGCTGATCTGAGAANDRGCQDPAQTLPVGCTETIPYSCTSGVCNAAGTACLCTSDNQCPSGACVNSGQAGCTSSTCTGTGSPDAANCVPSGVTNCTNPPPPAGNNSQCGGVNSVELCSTASADGGGPGLGQCQKACTSSAQCGGGETCTGGFCSGCNSSTNCYDRVYPKSCNGASGAVTGQCCGNGSPIPATSCGTNNTLFPEACLQTPLSDQEKALEFMLFDLTSCVTPDQGTASTPVLLTAKSFTLQFAASCPSGTKPRWREFDYQASFPPNAAGTYTATYPDNSIDFAAQTGGGLPGVNDAGGAFIPATPLQLGAPATTNTLPPNWVQILLDTAPGGTGLFTTATPTITSQVDLLMTITLTPTADQLSSPTLLAWRAEYDCPPSE